MGVSPSRERALEAPVASPLGRWRRRWQSARCDTPLGEVAQRLRFSHRLPWRRTASFDACRVDRVLQHVANPTAVVREMVRVLRPAEYWWRTTTTGRR